jgi:enterochelin esterase-like enzyme
MDKIVGLLILVLLTSCNGTSPSEVIPEGHQLIDKGDVLQIQYKGRGDVVQFKMFEGLSQILKKDDSGVFKGELTIPDLDIAVFCYDVIVHEKDSTGKMVDIGYKPENDRYFKWIGENRQADYAKDTMLEGKLEEVTINSKFLEEGRNLSIYTPPNINAQTPIIYMTDGSVVKTYAPYIDRLITDQKIKPVMLVGAHASETNRYEEYVNNGIKNDYFPKHEDFIYQEVFPLAESSIPAWAGKRYFYGFSNGGAFCMYAGINHPQLFEEIIALSTVDYISEFIKPIVFEHDTYPRFYMGAGRYERSFENNVRFSRKLKNNDIDVFFKEFVAGHDYFTWRIEFLEYLLKTFNQ